MRLFLRRWLPREAARRQAIRERAERLGGANVEDIILGANDGIITTFAIVAGATGGALSNTVILILGFANIFADAVSMGASNYLGKRSRRDYIESERRMESWEIDHVPNQEEEEIRSIFRDKGLQGERLECVVDAITSSKTTWLDTMMALELGLYENAGPLWRHGVFTFSAFAIAGFVPLIPYILYQGAYRFEMSAAVAAVTLFVAGALRTFITGVNWLRGGLEMLAVGSAAGIVAFMVGRLVSLAT